MPSVRHGYPITVVRAQAVVATRAGITVGEALFSDGLTARFRVLSRNPASVRVIADQRLRGHEQAVEAWLAAINDAAIEVPLFWLADTTAPLA